MNLLFLTFVFPLVGFVLLSFSRGRFSENLSALIGVGSVGLSAATGALGRHVRRVQSGQMHHYYTGIAAGLAVVVLILAIGGLP